MTFTERNFKKVQRLSNGEVAALTREVLERARQALHDVPETNMSGLPRRVRSELGTWVADNFECLIIAVCAIASAAAWLMQSSGA